MESGLDSTSASACKGYKLNNVEPNQGLRRICSTAPITNNNQKSVTSAGCSVPLNSASTCGTDCHSSEPFIATSKKVLRMDRISAGSTRVTPATAIPAPTASQCPRGGPATAFVFLTNRKYKCSRIAVKTGVPATTTA